MNHQLSSLLDAIDRKRELGIREFGKSDLYRNSSIEDLTQWYAQLCVSVRKKPPDKPAAFCFQTFPLTTTLTVVHFLRQFVS